MVPCSYCLQDVYITGVFKCTPACFHSDKKGNEYKMLVSLCYIWCQKCFLRCPSVKDTRSIREIGCQLGFFVALLSGLVSTPQTCNKSILIKTATNRKLSRHQNHT